MRIIGGSAAGLIIKAPSGMAVRPTPDLVRQAIFNSLGARVPGARVLDLFSGSGAIGLECLSRGAALVVSVEKSERHAIIIRQNVSLARLSTEHFELRVQDVFTALGQLALAGRVFDLVLADPPFGEKNIDRRSLSLSQRLLDDGHVPRLLAPGGLFVLGHTRRDTLTIPPPWQEVKTLKHGDSRICLLRLTERLAPKGAGQ